MKIFKIPFCNHIYSFDQSSEDVKPVAEWLQQPKHRGHWKGAGVGLIEFVNYQTETMFVLTWMSN